MKKNNSPGENGITAEVYQIYLHLIHNELFVKGFFRLGMATLLHTSVEG